MTEQGSGGRPQSLPRDLQSLAHELGAVVRASPALPDSHQPRRRHATCARPRYGTLTTAPLGSAAPDTIDGEVGPGSLVAMNIEFRPMVTAIAAGNEGHLDEVLNSWLGTGDGDEPNASAFAIDPQTERIKIDRGGDKNALEVRHAVDDWLAGKRRLKINEFSVHEYPWTIEIWRRFEIELRDGGYMATFADAFGGYKVTGANGVEIGSISVGTHGWVGMSHSTDSSGSATTTMPRDTPREAFGELLRTLGFKQG